MYFAKRQQIFRAVTSNGVRFASMYITASGVCIGICSIYLSPELYRTDSSRIPFLCLLLSMSALLLRWFGPHIPIAYVMMERTPVSSSARLMLGVIHVSTLTVSLSVASAFLLLSTVWVICSWSPPLPSVFTPRYLY